jgi:hypothetical protein
MTSDAETVDDELPLLKIKCTSSKCDDNKHCFKPPPKRRKKKSDLQTTLDIDGATDAGQGQFLHPEQTGRCRSCDAELIKWDRIHKRDIADAEYTVESLRLELIRDHFWSIPIDAKATAHAGKKGVSGIEQALEHRIRSNQIARGITVGKPTFDGRQTPRSGNVIYYAQHATATCCRKCMEVWHRIPRDRDMTEDEIKYACGLNMLYIRQRLPDLSENGGAHQLVQTSSSRLKNKMESSSDAT